MVSFVDTTPQVAILDVTCYTFSSSPVLLVGNTPLLGNWDPQRGLPLQFTGSLRGREQWQATVELQPGQTIEFKFVHNGAGGPEWEIGDNRTYTADAPTGLLEMYFRTGVDTWQRLLAGDRVIGGGNLTARGDIVRALEILVFLANSADRGLRTATLETVSAKVAGTIRNAIAADGYEPDNTSLRVGAVTMVGGRSSREIVVAHLPTGELDQSSIDYIVEDAVLVGALYKNPIW
jgi:hypothetical protein